MMKFLTLQLKKIRFVNISIVNIIYVYHNMNNIKLKTITFLIYKILPKYYTLGYCNFLMIHDRTWEKGPVMKS